MISISVPAPLTCTVISDGPVVNSKVHPTIAKYDDPPCTTLYVLNLKLAVLKHTSALSVILTPVVQRIMILLSSAILTVPLQSIPVFAGKLVNDAAPKTVVLIHST